LQERPEDISLLAQYFLDRFSTEFVRGALSFTPKARYAMQHYKWPGNVRELEHRIQKAVLLSTGKQVDATDLELKEANDPDGLSLRAAREEAERRTVIEALRLTGGNISKAAGVLGISRPSLHELLLRQDIHAREFRPPR
jgi:two-component system, NtrC family, response regulator